MSLLLIAVLILQNLLLPAVVLALLFTWKFSALALFVLAVVLDAYFGAFQSVPYFSMVAVVWYVVSELIRIRMRIME